MKVRIKVQPTGLLNGYEWPEVGGEIDVPDVVGADLCASGAATPVAEKKAEKKAEKRPASKTGEEKR
jgi:hypothetical protein